MDKKLSQGSAARLPNGKHGLGFRTNSTGYIVPNMEKQMEVEIESEIEIARVPLFRGLCW